MNPRKRLPWNDYFMKLALTAAERSPDPSRQVGAILTDESNRVLATGYNGLPRGMDEDLIDWSDRPLVRQTVIHAEANCLAYSCSMPKGSHLRLYSTTFPCHECCKLIVSHQIQHLFYLQPYPSFEEVSRTLQEKNILVTQVSLFLTE